MKYSQDRQLNGKMKSADVAQQVGCMSDWVRKTSQRTANGQFPIGQKIGHDWFYTEADVRRLLARKKGKSL